MNILQAIDDPQIFASAFRDRATWIAWRTFLTVLFGLPLDKATAPIAAKCTGRRKQYRGTANETFLVVGRRGGKSFALALIATFLATFRDYRSYLAPGEMATVTIIAADRRQARVIFRYIRGLLKASAMLAATIVGETRETITLRNRVMIEIFTASYKTTRGYTVVAALLDEVAFWQNDEQSANPDVEILNALRPALATIPNSMLLVASSPYARKGVLWDAYRSHHAIDEDPILVWEAATRTMNPTIPQAFIDKAYHDDPISAAAEYGAQFRGDISSFIDRDTVEACVSSDIRERPPSSTTRYFAFTDPSGGSSDSFTLAIGHKEDGIAILDAVRERVPPFAPEAVVDEFTELLRSYRISSVIGDRYAGEWPREQFRKRGIVYELSDKPKSDIYLNFLPGLNSAMVDLLDNPRLVNQLASLERRTARGGRDSIDHPPRAHDDVANAVAGCLLLSAARRPQLLTAMMPPDMCGPCSIMAVVDLRRGHSPPPPREEAGIVSRIYDEDGNVIRESRIR